MRKLKTWAGCLGVVAGTALVLATSALAHARVSPPVSLAKATAAVQPRCADREGERDDDQGRADRPARASGSTRSCPAAGLDAAAATDRAPERSAVIQKVTWTGGSTPTGEDSLFQFLAQPASAETYTFQVQQTYSDGSIVDWSGPESSDAPAPTIEAKARSAASGTSRR